jgi:hypothetical protein
MAQTCTITLKVDKLPRIVERVEHYMFQALASQGLTVFDLVGPNKEKIITEVLLPKAKILIGADAEKYIRSSAILTKRGDTEGAETFDAFASNLQELLATWPQITANFLNFSSLFKVKNKFKIGEDGLVDLADTGDEEKAIFKKLVFDQQANEIDPFDNIDKAIELFIRSIPKSESYDPDYGGTKSVDYTSFVKILMGDLENTIDIREMIDTLQYNLKKVPEYQHILDMLVFKDTDSALEQQLKINFRNSFCKATIPIYVTSIEGGIVKVFEGTIGKRSAYEKEIQSNFGLRGMTIPSTKIAGKDLTNLATQRDNVWGITKDDLTNIKEFIEKAPLGEVADRKLQLMEALGFVFSPETKTKHRKQLDATIEKSFIYIFKHLEAIVEDPRNAGFVTEPFKLLRRDVYGKSGMVSANQASSTNSIMEFELKYNTVYNVERSIINADGNQQHASQLHMNFTVVNKYLSDAVNYPDLQTILEKQPSMFWLDPEVNPVIRDSIYLNSLFFLDRDDEATYGKRRRVTMENGKLVYSATKGNFVKSNVNNVGGIQLKDGGNFKIDSASSTDLNEVDKLMHDIVLFNMKGFGSIQRLNDKSTDLGIHCDYYVSKELDSKTGKVIEVPKSIILKDLINVVNIFSTDQFRDRVVDGMRDVARMKYLEKRGFYKDLKISSVQAKESWGEFDYILKRDPELMKRINEALDKSTSIDTVGMMFDDVEIRRAADKAITGYFNEVSQEFRDRFKQVKKVAGNDEIVKKHLTDASVNFYLANMFLMDLENMKVFFGNSIFFTAFTKRASKDSATGTFTFMDDDLVRILNDRESNGGYGFNTNLGARLLAERLFAQGKITDDERVQIISRQDVAKGFKSAVMKDVKFVSQHGKIIKENIEKLRNSPEKFISDENYNIYKKAIEGILEDKYQGKEGDGQGKCTFDFYRIMSILTGDWDQTREAVYKKIVEYAHYDELASEEQDETKRAEYIQKRDAVGYDPMEQVYFPPKKFQYTGPMKYMQVVDSGMYGQMVPIFDKFSLQPLIPTLVKGTTDEDLAKRMEFNGVGYVKFETGTKAETMKNQDDYYSEYDENNPTQRKVAEFDKQLRDKSYGFKSEQILFFNHLKEQVRTDDDVHVDVVFGSQIRKLILMNLLSEQTTFNRDAFVKLYKNYMKQVEDLTTIEKTVVYDKLGLKEEDGKLSLKDMNKLIEYFFTEIDKKSQSINVKKALNFNAETKQFDIPLDAAMQAQVIEGILVSSLNNSVVRYKTKGSMLTQVAITGSEAKKFNKDKSREATETFGNSELQYYNVKTKNGKTVVSKMQVKVGFTKQHVPLLSLMHPDNSPIATFERLNEAVKDENWREANAESIQMISYRIPTQQRSFMDVMEIVQFLPAQFGDAIIMPTEAMIKSGSDFDYDKMFTFYTNLDQKTGKAITAEYTDADLKRLDAKLLKPAIQNKLNNAMADILLHPSNYMELVTPSANYEIDPIVNKIYTKLGLKKESDPRPKTDYKHTDILNRNRNIEKFLSLLNGKSDLGIAAIANTFNVLFQLAKAQGNPKWFADKNIKSFFTTKTSIKTNSEGVIEKMFLGDVYDEEGMFKSEFFSEFINAFVDVGNDDYVFAVNVVTEFSPMMFNMKYAGLSSEKILYFVNQPVLRAYIKNLSTYQNMFVKNYFEKEKKVSEDQMREIQSVINREGISGLEEAFNLEREQLSAIKSAAKRKALSETLKQMGVSDFKFADKTAVWNAIIEKDKNKIEQHFSPEVLYKNIKNEKTDVSTLTAEEKQVQLMYLHEMLNQKECADSMTNGQRVLNFDTNPFENSFDVYRREALYKRAIEGDGDNILSPTSIINIKNRSIISSLDVSREIKLILEKIMPMRNNPTFNSNILKLALSRSNNFLNESVRTQEDMMRFARTFKNDFNTYLLHNMLGKSAEGDAFFKEQFSTTKSYTEYMKELVATPKLVNLINEIKALPNYDRLYSQYPILKFIIEQGGSNKKLINFKFLENGMNSLEKNSMIAQFEDLVNLGDPEFAKVKELFRDLALYATFQSGMNTSDNSYTDVTPIELINKLYGFGVDEFMKLPSADKLAEYEKFNKMFIKNNPGFEAKRKLNDTPTKDVAKMGKWYSNTSLFEKQKEVVPTTPVPTGKKAIVKTMADTTTTKKAAKNREGIYSMRPNATDNIPGVTETQNFGNPWSERGLSEIKASSIAEAVGNYKRWLLGEDFKDVQPKKREWIINMINSGRLDGKPFLYFKGGYISHAHILVDIINNRQKYNLVAKTVVKKQITEIKKFDIKREKFTGDINQESLSDISSEDVSDVIKKLNNNTANLKIDVISGKDFGTDNKITNNQVIYLLHSEGKKIAVLSINDQTVTDNRPESSISGVFVHPNLKGKGLGKAIYRFVNNDLINKGRPALKSDFDITPDAIKVWESLVKSGEAIKTGTNEKYNVPTFEMKSKVGIASLSNIETINTKIDNWINQNLPSLVSMSTEDIISMYETDKKSGETIEDFLHRMTCNGKLI